MNFGEAILILKQGNCVARQGWNGKGMYLYLDDVISCTPEGEFVSSEPVIVMFTAQRKYQAGWLASQQDILAEDWERIERS